MVVLHGICVALYCYLYGKGPVPCTPALLMLMTTVHAVLGVSALLSMLMHAMVNAKHELSACIETA